MNADHEHWSQIAPEWVAWARTPNHDAFWAYRASLLAFIGRVKVKRLMLVAVRGASLGSCRGVYIGG
jgi:hypothetical protein